MKALRVGCLLLLVLALISAITLPQSSAQAQPPEQTNNQAARAAYAQAQELARSVQTRAQATSKYLEALELYRLAGDREGQSRTLVSLAITYDSLDDKQRAVESLQQALALERSMSNKAAEAGLLNALALIQFSMQEKRKALEAFTLALAIIEQLEERPGESSVLVGLGRTLSDLGEKHKALGVMQRALPLLRKENNRRGEAIALNILGSINADIGENEKAIEYYTESLALRRAENDRTGEASTLNNIARIHQFIGENRKALDLHQQVLLIRREVGDRSGEAVTLNNIGTVYDSLGERHKAIEFFNLALPLRRAVGDRAGESATLNNLGAVYNSLGESQKAIAFYEEALKLSRDLEDLNSQASTLNNIGAVYSGLGDKEKALEYYKQTLSIRKAISDREGEARALNNMGSMYKALKRYKEAVDAYLEASRIQQEIGDRQGRVTTLANVGDLYASFGEHEKALDFLNISLKGFQELGSRGQEATVLGNIGLVYSNLGDHQKALHFYNRSLTLRRAVVDPQGEAVTLTNLMFAWKASQPGLAVFYGKQAVNTLQQLRANISGLEEELQKTFLRSREDVYRTLADLLIEQGRLPEAQHVLSLLKEEEYFAFVRRDGNEASWLTGRADLTPEEAELEKRYSELSHRVASIGIEYLRLRDKSVRTEREELRLAELEKEIVVANQIFQKFLDEIDKAFKATSASSEKAFQLRESQGLMETLRELGRGTLALYTVVTDNRYHVILVTPAIQKAYTHEIGAADLNRKILEFREAIQNPRIDPRPLGRELYKILIGAELEKDLKQAQGQTLMWSLDGVLRYLPVAALHDGEKYLVQSYRNVVFTPASQSRLKDPVNAKWKALGFGVSKPHKGFSPLPGVAEELRGIIRDETTNATAGVLTGRLLLDEAFTGPSMQAALRQPYQLVHIASHFSFKPGNETDSFLLLGDGSYLTLAQIKSLPNIFRGVDLLTLSACDTATGGAAGNGKEIEGFGVLAQRQGAKAVMATLWPVADYSTQVLMREFYRLRDANPNWTKVEALRQAQLGLLTGKITVDAKVDAQRAELVGTGARPGPIFQPDKNAPYAHPYYWAPFILIGNWR